MTEKARSALNAGLTTLIMTTALMSNNEMQGASKASAENGSTVSPMVLAAARAMYSTEHGDCAWDAWQYFEPLYVGLAQSALTSCGALECLEALEHIGEYWNQDQNETAMADACWHAINTAHDVVAKVYGSNTK